MYPINSLESFRLTVTSVSESKPGVAILRQHYIPQDEESYTTILSCTWTLTRQMSRTGKSQENRKVSEGLSACWLMGKSCNSEVITRSRSNHLQIIKKWLASLLKSSLHHHEVCLEHHTFWFQFISVKCNATRHMDRKQRTVTQRHQRNFLALKGELPLVTEIKENPITSIISLATSWHLEKNASSVVDQNIA